MHLSNVETIPVIEAWLGDWRISLRRRSLDQSDLANLYDQRAGDWDMDLSHLRVEDAYKQALAPVLSDLRPGARLLDCGIGTGAFSAAVLRSLPFNLDIHGVDISPDMIDQAGARLERLGVEPTLHVSDASALDYEDESFDWVICAHMLEHLADPQAALAEMVRVLRPGGRLVVCVTRNSWFGRHIQLNWRTWAVSKTQAEDWLVKADLRHVTFLKPKNRPVFNQMSLVCTAQKN